MLCKTVLVDRCLEVWQLDLQGSVSLFGLHGCALILEVDVFFFYTSLASLTLYLVEGYISAQGGGSLQEFIETCSSELCSI